ncbi:putative exported protein [Minicystis rosea]|nr:putative exported protein [Minicystis rosea]
MALLPPPRLKDLDNRTGLTVFQYDKMAPGRVFCDVVAVKAAFALTPEGLLPIPGPGAIYLADTHRQEDDPTGSSLVEVGDLILGKPGADIFLTGSARSERPSERWRVGVTVGRLERPLAQVECAVTGPRSWRHSSSKGWHLGPADVTNAVPIHYELAYGGRKPNPEKPRDQWDAFAANPSGSGYDFDAYSTADTPPGPQWEPAGGFDASGTRELIGLGPVARFWASRRQFAGTYDEAWRRQFEEEAIPDYPPDFDQRFFQCAHPQLQTSAPLRGDEDLHLSGLLAETAHLATRLPGFAVVASWGEREAALLLDTVHVDLDDRVLQLGWHLTLPQHLGIEHVGLNLERL